MENESKRPGGAGKRHGSAVEEVPAVRYMRWVRSMKMRVPEDRTVPDRAQLSG